MQTGDSVPASGIFFGFYLHFGCTTTGCSLEALNITSNTPKHLFLTWHRYQKVTSTNHFRNRMFLMRIKGWGVVRVRAEEAESCTCLPDTRFQVAKQNFRLWSALFLMLKTHTQDPPQPLPSLMLLSDFIFTSLKASCIWNLIKASFTARVPSGLAVQRLPAQALVMQVILQFLTTTFRTRHISSDF